MEIEEKRQQQRNGNLGDIHYALDDVLPGELLYAKDARRLFIGNDPVTLDGDSIQTEFNFGVDADAEHMYAGAFKVLVDDVLQVDGVDYTHDDLLFTFTTAPPAGTGNIVFKYLSEIHLFEPDVGLDIPSLVELTPVAVPGTPEPITSVAFDGTRYDNIDIRYSLRNATGGFRKGVLSIAIDPVANAHTVTDNYTSNVVGTSLDHSFTGVTTAGQFVLYYDTTDATSVNLSWLTDNFKATV